MNERRRRGLEKEISRIIGTAILLDVKNEKVKNLVTVKNVNLSPDGRYADIIFSILDYKENINKEKMLEDLNKLKGFFRKKVGENLEIRFTPELRVHLDDTIEYSVKISKLLRDAAPKNITEE
ncbi:30S ribosome-binding factor RbfA [Pseudostreptobacillus hongkongensis]|uniref:30S ribosome-binding factor RbfA n=1 Tax=Pseudostreptobacillus hongkongensis TaxID=1162717 RepID=UPI000835A8C3|nr:30S ribosome-binding factor RbfA [Pseudostreptobacillus hongkongensis]